MEPLTEAQSKSLGSHCERAVYKNTKGEHGANPLFIRVGESRIYAGKPMHKALLKEVIYMRMHDLHENDLRIPKFTPWSSDYRKNEGWCYASQKYLANRVGSKDPSYISRVLRQIRDDGYIKIRSYRISGRGSQRRNQYFADEAFINARIVDLGVVPDEESDDNSDGVLENHTGSVGLKPNADGDKAYRPLGIKPTDREGLKQFPLGVNPKEYALEVASEFDLGVRSTSTAPTASPSEEKMKPSLRSEDQKPEATPTPKSKPNGVGSSGLKAESKPADDLAAYLTDDEPEKKAGRKPTPITSSAPSGYCPRCGEANGKHVNQPGMVCPVLKAKAAAAPRAFDVRQA